MLSKSLFDLFCEIERLSRYYLDGAVKGDGELEIIVGVGTGTGEKISRDGYWEGLVSGT